MTSVGDYLIGLDLGTSAIKGVLTDGQGCVLAETGAETEFLRPRNGWYEVDPEQRYQSLCRVLRKLAEQAPGEVRALAMAAASGNTLLTDADGRPLTNIINWMDERGAQSPPAALAGLTSATTSQITGWPCVTSFPLAHLAWLKEHASEDYRKAGHYAMDTDWLVHGLTGCWRMDHSTASTFHLQEQTTGAYYEPFLDRLQIPSEKLSKLVNSGVSVAPLTGKAAKDTGLSPQTFVATGCFDHPAAARGVGVLEPGQLLLSCGTSWVGFTPCMDRQAILDAEMLCDPFLAAAGGAWGGMFSVPSIGPVIDAYVRETIASGENDPMRVFNEAAAEAAAGADGLAIDLRLPPRPIDADRKTIARAVMEGAARLLSEKIDASTQQGFDYDSVVMVGGPANSPIWPRIVAEITGLELTVGSQHAGAQGAAVLAGMATGVYRDETDAMERKGKRS